MQQISFIVNTSVNTLEHVKLLLKSFKENLYGKEHEILIFIDSDNEGTFEYLQAQKADFYDLKIITHNLPPCIGYSRNNNILAELAKHDVISYLQSDMIISKNYDLNILEELEPNCILSSTRIEPPLHGISDKTITRDFGVYPEEFKFKEFVEFAEAVKEDKTLSYFFAPYTFYKDVWTKLGGYTTLHRRSREDSDLVQKCIYFEVKLKQTFKANVYHFSCVSSRGKDWFNQKNQEAQERVKLQQVADQIELRRFVRKWGSFNHGESLLTKLDIDLKIVGATELDRLRLAFNMEPFFSRVWLDTEESKQSILKTVELEHQPANTLLRFTEEQWKKAKQFYLQVDYNEIYKIGDPKNYNISVTLDLDKQSDIDFSQYLTNLTELLQEAEPGTYEVGNATIEVRQVVKIIPSTENPPFDYSLINIY